MGACFDCVVTVDGRIGQRACMTPVRDGRLVVTGDATLPLAQLGQEPDAATAEDRLCDVLVVGGGVAGLSAAIAAAEAGASVVVVDERSAPGGQFAKPLADSHTDAAPDPQFRLGAELRERALAAGVRIETDATVWGGFAADEIAALVDGRAVTFRPRRLVLATGAHERPVPLPGWTLPGVMTTGSLQTLVRAQRVCPGEHVLIAGSGPLNLQLACELLACGVKPLAVVEAAPRPRPAAWRQALTMARAAPDLVRQGLGMLLTLKRAGVPVLWSARVNSLHGETRVQSAQIVGRTFDRSYDVDVVALNLGFQPETGLARALGARHRFVDMGIGHVATETDGDGRTSGSRACSPPVTVHPSAARALRWHAAGWRDSQRRAISAFAHPMNRAPALLYGAPWPSRRRCGHCSRRRACAPAR